MTHTSELKRRLAAFLPAGALLAALSTGCVMNEKPSAFNASPILCEASYVNHAWGLSVHFRGVDRQGRIFSFDGSDVDTESRREIIPTESPTAEDLARRYAAARPTGAVVPLAVVAEMERLAESIRGGELSYESGGADVGQYSYDCLLPGPGGTTFERVLVASHGDLMIENQAAGASDLLQLLEQHLDPIQ